MLNILKFCFSYAVCLLPNFVSGLLGVGLRGDWVRSAATYVTVSFEDILGNGGGFWGKLHGIGDSFLSSIGDVRCYAVVM